MAGLLDAFNDPQFQRGLMMFAASTPMSEQQRAGLLSYIDNQEQYKQQRELMGIKMEGERANLDGKKMELEAAKRAQAQREQAMGLLGGWMGGTPNASAGDVARLGRESTPGFAGPVSPQAQATAQAPARTLADMPYETALQIEMLGGPKLRDYLKDAKTGIERKPNTYYETAGGVKHFGDPEKGITVDANGRVVAMPGAMQTLAGLAGATEGAKQWAGVGPALARSRGEAGIAAAHDTMQVYNPATQRMEFAPRSAVLANASPSAATPLAGGAGNIQSPGYAGGSRNAANSDSLLILQRELQNPNLTAEDRAAIGREIGRLQGQSGPMAAGPSAQDLAAQEAARVKAVDQAKADVAVGTKQSEATKKSGQLISVMDEAIGLLKKGPTASLVGAGADMLTNALGMPTKGAELAQQLEALSGWAVANVPRMEGPQSDRDVANYITMAGRVGDRALPTQVRIAAAEQVKTLQQKYAHLNPGEQPAQKAAEAPKGSWRDYGYSSSDQMIQDARNAIMRNPAARDEVNRRLGAAGLSLNTGGW